MIKEYCTAFIIAVCFTAVLNAQTRFSEGSGKYGLLLNDLKSNLYDNGMLRTVNLAGGEQRMFITCGRGKNSINLRYYLESIPDALSVPAMGAKCFLWQADGFNHIVKLLKGKACQDQVFSYLFYHCLVF